jgi:hypothetical protein
LKKFVLCGEAYAQWWCEENRHAHSAQKETLNFSPLFSSDELKMQTTPMAVTPFAGMASFFLGMHLTQPTTICRV